MEPDYPGLGLTIRYEPRSMLERYDVWRSAGRKIDEAPVVDTTLAMGGAQVEQRPRWRCCVLVRCTIAFALVGGSEASVCAVKSKRWSVSR
jgi:hypothetical protein